MSERRRPPPRTAPASAPPTANTPERLRQPDSPGTPLAPLFAPQDLLAARYRVRRFLARGGMGEVYEAIDRDLGIAVALKTLRPEVASSPLAVKRLKREVLLARSVTSPHVCRIYDLGRHRAKGREVTFLTMELLDGETLAARIRDRGKLTPVEVLPLVRQMAEALEAAHRAGVVHRDFKSGNVFVARDSGGERAVVTDFGLAHAAGSDGEGRERTHTGVAAGTPAYMAPEQVEGKEVGPAADLYALGVVLFEMVTGKLPFEGRTTWEGALARLTEDPPSPRTAVPDLDPCWEGVILRLLRRDPGARFAGALEAVRALEGETKRPVAHRLPAELDVFVGREEELGEIGKRFQGGTRLLTLLGTAGAGKTRLARRFGWSSLESWPGGVWFSDLSAASDLDGVLGAVAMGLDVPLASGDAAEQLGHAIAGRGRCLVILDNLEQVVAEAGPAVARWVDRAREAAFLVTSRQRLNLEGEEVLPLEPLPVEGEGVELFEVRARAQRPGYAVNDANREAVREVVRLLDGLPLAIELAAARLRVLTERQVLERLADRFTLLVGGQGERGRQTTLRAALDWSWELLLPWEKAALAQMSVFEGGFTLDAVEAVVELDAFPEAPAVLDALQGLLDKSLLRRLASGTDRGKLEEPRFAMYVSVQEYARERLREEGAVPGGLSGSEAERASEARHGRHYAGFGTQEALEALDAHGGVETRRQLGRELDNLVAASRRAAGRGDGEVAAAAYRAACAVLALQGPYGAAVELGRLVEGTAGLSPSERRTVLHARGLAAAYSGRMEEARAHYVAALAIPCEGGDRGFEGAVLGRLGNVHFYQGRMEEAREHFEAALAIHREMGRRRSEGHILGNLGALHDEQGRMEEARAHFERALAIHREVGDRRSEGIALGSLGGLHLEQGRMEEAREHFEAALAIHREMGDRRFEGVVLVNLGNLHLEQGRMEAARAHLEAALAIHREMGGRRVEGCVLAFLGALHLAQGSLAGAADALEPGERLLRAVGARLELGKLLCVRAELEDRRGEADRARATLGEAEALAAEAKAGPDSELGRKLARLRGALGIASGTG